MIELILPLIGRDDMIELVLATLVEAAGSILFVGAAGVGKTRLGEECLAAASGAGFVTARVQGSRAAKTIPFGAVSPLLPVTPVERVPSEHAALVAGRTAISALGAGGRPAVILVDDAHLLDDASAVLLHQCAASGAARLIVTVRSGTNVPDPVTALWKDGHAERIDVGPLSRADVGVVLERALDGPVDGRFQRDIWNATLGNALFVRELLLDVLQAGTLRRVNGLWTLAGSLAAPARLVELIDARLASLGPDELETVDLVALGEPLGLEILRGLTSSASIERLEAGGLLEIRADGARVVVRLVHPLHGETLRANMTLSRAHAYRRRLADALEAVGGRRREDALVIGRLRFESGGSADPDLMLRAAREALYRWDLPLCERLARVAWESGADPAAALLMAEAYDMQGRYDDAVRQFTVALAHATSDESIMIGAKGIASSYFWGLHDEEAAREANRAGQTRLPAGPSRDELVCQLATFDVLEGRLEQGLPVLCDLAEAQGRAAVDATVAAAPALAVSGRTAEATRIATRGAELHAGIGDGQMLTEAGVHVVGMVIAMTEAGRLDEAEALGKLGYLESVDASVRVGQAWFALVLGRAALYQGRFVTAERWFVEGASVFNRPSQDGPRRWCLGGLIRARAEAGDITGAAAALDDLLAMERTPVRMMEPDLDRAVAWLTLMTGERGRAIERLWAAADDAAAAGSRALEAGALHDLARAGEAPAVRDRMTAVASACDGELVPAEAAHVAALGARDAGALEAVATRFGALGAARFGAEAAHAAASLWRAAGDERGLARNQRLEAELRARCQPAAFADGGGAGRSPSVLTPREAEIAALAAEGLASREIARLLGVSVRTVDNHLQHVYVKLGVSNRVALAQAIRRPS